MKTNFKLLGLSAMISVMGLMSCEDKNDTDSENPSTENPNTELFTVAAEVSGEPKSYYMATAEDLTTGELTFQGNGTEIGGGVSARVVGENGYIYVLNYGTGFITQFIVQDNGEHKQISEIDVSGHVGTHPRIRLVDDLLLLYYPELDANDGKYKLSVVSVSIPDLKIVASVENITIPTTPQSAAENAYIYRVDSPTILDGKIYFGAARRIDDVDDELRASGLETVVLNYPEMDEISVIHHEGYAGHTYGYRAPSMYKVDGYVYQLNGTTRFGFNTDKTPASQTVITRMKDGKYDEEYVFNLNAELSDDISAVGWFAVGNGIGYVPVMHGENNEDWSVARIDLKSNTAVELNVPHSNLFSYQNGVTDNGYFYMAISPGTADSWVYEFDINSTSPDAFSQGLELDGGNVFIQGIYR
ncbi:DUF4374 domain-containing protein [Sediminitomix flava]|uniref:Uncharacterized protein DUF4374 n=1 Tax=Sediminitomix flava TaxID=379075 RepID=A0A315ZES2_SEDFL|nr:DUF4374 domain-containing protein [Sediminitomix flava]PWJ43224.1 uncharacterized protein DUF4374 [Sediminitomix flava]